MFEIYTLGNFDIKYNGKSILDMKGYPYKTFKLFKYFITNEGKKLLPENIIEDLWEDNEYNDPQGALRTQISRVRKMIDIERLNLKPFFTIQYLNGYYVFKLGKEATLDARKFETLINPIKPPKDKLELENTLKEAICIYNGDYLQELNDEDWLISIRMRYDRLYLKALLAYLQILLSKKQYHDIISICEKAIEHKFYEEIIHIYFLEALIKIGQERYAANHYEFYTSKFYNDLGVPPSKKAKEIYIRLQTMKENISEKIIDMDIIKTILREDKTEGPLVCDFSYFKFLYNFEIRNIERNKDKDIILSIITIDNSSHKILRIDDLKEAIKILKSIIYNTLRKGDVVTQWNDSQLMILLYNINIDNIDGTMKRIVDQFDKQKVKNDIILSIKSNKV